MVAMKQAKEILRALSVLPPEKVAEVHDFVLFLKERYEHGGPVDDSEAWTEEDMKDLTTAVLNYANQTVWTEADKDG